MNPLKQLFAVPNTGLPEFKLHRTIRAAQRLGLRRYGPPIVSQGKRFEGESFAAYKRRREVERVSVEMYLWGRRAA